MVKKTDIHARVLRPGESTPLNFTSSEFEIVLFRPKCHSRIPAAVDSAPEAEEDCVAAEGNIASDSANNTDGVNTTMGESRRSLTGIEAGGEERKRGVHSSLSSRSSAGGLRDSTAAATVDQLAASPPAPIATSIESEEGALTDGAAGAPLFFDTTVCIFYDEQSKIDYVATGRATDVSKGIRYKPHLVVLGSESTSHGYCNFNITQLSEEFEESSDEMFEEETSEEDSGVIVSRTASSNGPVTMAAADGIEVSLMRLSMCAGFLVCATLFGKESSLNCEQNVFYMVRRPKSTIPHCLVPLCVQGESSSSCISLMVRKVRTHGEMLWELVNVSEPLPFQDVKTLLLQLQQRGLADPSHFTRDYEVKAVANRGGDVPGGGAEGEESGRNEQCNGGERTLSTPQSFLSEAIDPERSVTSAQVSVTGEAQYPLPISRSGRTFSTLLTDVPRVAREGRRQYNVGRSHVQTALLDGDTSGVDEVLDDAMRAVVPCYANASLVRYENGAYNVGSRVANLVTHYVDRREMYGLFAAARHSNADGKLGGSRDRLLPHLGGPRMGSSADCVGRSSVLDRYHSDDSEFAARPPLPPDLLLTPKERLRAAALQQHRRSSSANSKKRRSPAGSASRSSSRRRRKGRKGRKRTPGRRGRGKSRSKSKKK